jgi:hypothetical protein
MWAGQPMFRLKAQASGLNPVGVLDSWPETDFLLFLVNQTVGVVVVLFVFLTPPA